MRGCCLTSVGLTQAHPNYVCDLQLSLIANSMGNCILLTVHASMFCTIQEPPAAIESQVLDDTPPSSLGSCGSDAPLLPGVVTPDLLIMYIIHL